MSREIRRLRGLRVIGFVANYAVLLVGLFLTPIFAAVPD